MSENNEAQPNRRRPRAPQYRVPCGPETLGLLDRESTRFIGSVMAEHGTKIYKADVVDAALRFAFSNPAEFRAALLAAHEGGGDE